MVRSNTLSCISESQLCGREQRAFLNGGRTDKLVLKHWVKASTAPDAGVSHYYFLGTRLIVAEYPFAQYNVSSGAYSYTDEEYARLLDGMSRLS